MNILFLTPQLPYPPRQGTTIRNYNLILHLAPRHTIDLLTFLAPGEHLAADNPLHALCRRIAAVEQPRRSTGRRAADTLTTLTPDMGLRLESPAMWDLIRAWTAQTHYDIVQIEGIELAQYGMAVAGKRPGQAPGQAPARAPDRTPAPRPALVFDNHNCEYLLQQRNAMNDLSRPARWPAAAYSLAQWQKLRAYEARVINAADATVAVSAADRTAMQRIAPDAPITVVSNGIDLTLYRPEATASLDLQAPKFVFTGKMDYRPNIDAALWCAQEVLPLVTAQEPHARLQLVGMNPHPRLDALRTNPHVEITGAVPDTRPYITGAAVYVIPMRVGGGTRFKALEAMACGKAIVSTRLGIEGIAVAHEGELLLADSPAEFAAAILRLLADLRAGGVLAGALGVQARAFVEEHYGWPTIIPQLDKVYQRVYRDVDQAVKGA